MEFQRICLVHYHEIGLKGHNRASFEMRLLRNIEALLDGFPIVTIHRISGRLLVFIKEGTSWEVACRIEDRILGIPGVARVSCGYKTHRDLGELCDAARKPWPKWGTSIRSRWLPAATIPISRCIRWK